MSGLWLAQESLLQGKLTCSAWLQGQLRLLQADKELADWVLCTEVLWGSDAQVVQVQEHQVSGQLRLLQVAQWSEAQVLQAHQQLLAQRCREVLLVSEAQVQRAQELQPGLRLAGESLVRQGQLTCSVSLQEPGQLRLLQLPQELAPWPCTEVLRRSTAQKGRSCRRGCRLGSGWHGRCSGKGTQRVRCGCRNLGSYVCCRVRRNWRRGRARVCCGCQRHSKGRCGRRGCRLRSGWHRGKV